MRTSSYRALLAIPAVRQVLVLRFFIGTPFFAANVILVLHVVGHLDRSYAEAGLVEAVYAVALTVSNPWRGRLLDRIGLRRTLGPSIVVMALCWAIAPWVPYPALLPLVFVAGLFVVPMSVVRLVLMAHAGAARRTAVLSMDSVVVESTFMLGPVLGVLAATSLPTPWVLLTAQMLVVAGAAWLWTANPSFAVEDDEPAPAPSRRRLGVPSWVSLGVVGVLLVAVASTVVLHTEDLGTVAALREADRASAIGWVLALWGFSSLLGGLAYGMLRRHPPSWVLIGLLAASTMLVAAADGLAAFVVLLFVSGFFCAPTITATTDDLARLVPVAVRGEAMGWHQSAMTLGGAVGAPVAGAAIDAAGWHGGFLVGGGVGLAIAAVAAFTYRRVPPRTPPDSDPRDTVAVGGLADRFGDGGTDPGVER